MGFFSFSTHFPPSGRRLAIQLRLIAHIWLSVVIFRNREPNRAVKNEFTSRFNELRTFFLDHGGPRAGFTVGEMGLAECRSLTSFKPE